MRVSIFNGQVKKAGDMKSLSIAASAGLGTLTFLLLLAIMGIVILRRYLKTLNGPKIERQFGAYITTKEPPEFTIPPYTLISEGTGSEGTATPCSEVGEIENDEPTAKFSPLAVRRSLSMPIPSTPPGQRHGFVIARNKESAECGTVEEGIATKEYRPQFRRAVSQYVMLPKREPLKKVSVAPYGKLEVSIQFMTEKNLLFVQVCFHHYLKLLFTCTVAKKSLISLSVGCLQTSAVSFAKCISVSKVSHLKNYVLGLLM